MAGEGGTRDPLTGRAHLAMNLTRAEWGFHETCRSGGSSAPGALVLTLGAAHMLLATRGAWDSELPQALQPGDCEGGGSI